MKDRIQVIPKSISIEMPEINRKCKLYPEGIVNSVEDIKKNIASVGYVLVIKADWIKKYPHMPPIEWLKIDEDGE